MKKLISIVLLLLLAAVVCPAVLAGNVEGGSTVNMTVEVLPPVVSPPPPSDGGNGGGNNGGGVGEFEDRSITSADDSTSLLIPEGTVMRNSDGQVLPNYYIGMTESTKFPPPPEDSSIIGLPYDLKPSGATFKPPLVLTFTYNPEDLPEGITEDSLVLAFYDGTAWVELECVVDTENNTITALVSHFTEFAIIGKIPVVVPAVVEPSPVVPPTPSEPTPPTPVTEPSVEAPSIVTPPIVPTTPDPLPVVVPISAPIIPEKSSHWGWIISGIAIVLILAGLAIWIVRRKKD